MTSILPLLLIDTNDPCDTDNALLPSPFFIFPIPIPFPSASASQIIELDCCVHNLIRWLVCCLDVGLFGISFAFRICVLCMPFISPTPTPNPKLPQNPLPKNNTWHHLHAYSYFHLLFVDHIRLLDSGWSCSSPLCRHAPWARKLGVAWLKHRCLQFNYSGHWIDG